MNQENKTFVVTNFSAFRTKMLNWVNRFSIFCLLDNSQYHFSDASFECLLGAGCTENIVCSAGNAFDKLKEFYDRKPGWLMGHLGFGLKLETEQVPSSHADKIGFSDLHFFRPAIVIRLKEKEVLITATDPDEVYNAIVSTADQIGKNMPPMDIQHRFSKEDYLSAITKLQQHILRGDCYEINFCQEFFAENAQIEPLEVYQQLTTVSPNPFASFYRYNDQYCICASPERYLKKTGSRLLSQPIKGTSKRDADPEKDMVAIDYLLQNSKEKSENVMVVDLVRNDLSRVCSEGSVKVDELFGIYSFPQVHQMISTVSVELKPELHWVDALRYTFPMGSMTGAPKKRVLELIDHYEATGRGLFSGAIGYISPEADFDFNVVIRSVLYDAATKYLSFQTGGGITFYSDAEKEYEESLLKGDAILRVLRGHSS